MDNQENSPIYSNVKADAIDPMSAMTRALALCVDRAEKLLDTAYTESDKEKVFEYLDEVEDYWSRATSIEWQIKQHLAWVDKKENYGSAE